MAARGRRAPDANPASGTADLEPRRITPVDSAILNELEAKVDRLVVMVETVQAPRSSSGPSGETLRSEVRAEVRAAVADMAHQLQSAIHGLTERMAGETVSLRGGLQLALEEGQRREAQGQDSLRAVVQEAVGEVLQRQVEDRDALRAYVEASLADTRDQFRSDMKALVAQLGDQRADSHQQLRAAFDATLGEQKIRAEIAELKDALQLLRSVVVSTAEDSRRQLVVDFEAAMVRRDQALGTLLAEESQVVAAQFRSALEEVVTRHAQSSEARRAELEAALADSHDQLQQALSEETTRLRALEASLLGQAAQTRNQWRADLEAALTAGRDVAVALVSEATERLIAAGEQVTASIAQASDDQLREQAEQLNDLQAAFEDLTSAIGLERRELRTAVESGLDTSEIIERLEALTASTSAGATNVATALEKLRRQPRADSQVTDTLMALYEELERLRRRVPTRSELRLADDQLAVIVRAVKSAGAQAGPAAKSTRASKAAPPSRRAR